MSVKFQETVQQSTTVTDAAGKHGHEHHHLLHELGEKLTKGGGPNGYLAVYLQQLQSNPLRTKMLTSGTLSGLQEFLASWIAHDRSKSGHYFTSRVPKMALYGALISAPLGHVLISMLQRIFQGRKSLKAKVMQILVSNLIISPIQNSVYLVSMALIAGARTFHQVRATVKAGFWPVMKVSWIVSPISLAFAQQFLPEHTWVPFFNIIGFIIGTYINAHTKKKRLAALRRKHYGDASGRGTMGGRPGDRGGLGDRPGDRYGDRPGDRYGEKSERYSEARVDKYGDKTRDTYGEKTGDRMGDRPLGDRPPVDQYGRTDNPPRY